jgi:ABC-type Zn uptake system ZnuABC Zn-binding protein ZnuA
MARLEGTPPRGSGRLTAGKGLAAVTALAALTTVVGCSPQSTVPSAVAADDGRIRIVASIAPLADLARRVGGDRVVVTTLVPAGASEHTWEPTPRAVARLGEVRLFLRVGAGFEPWAGRLVAAVASDAPQIVTIDASQGVDFLADGAHGHGADEHGPEEGTGAAHANPHYWLDPASVSLCLPRLADALAAIDPADEEGYRRRAAQTRADLDALDLEIRDRTARLSSRGIITFHAAWDYFARRYGLAVVASIEAFPGREPGPRRVAEIVDLARRANVRAIFAEPQSSAKPAAAIAAECGIPVRVLDPVGGEGIPGRGDYFSLMRYNVGVLEEVLR